MNALLFMFLIIVLASLIYLVWSFFITRSYFSSHRGIKVFFYLVLNMIAATMLWFLASVFVFALCYGDSSSSSCNDLLWVPMIVFGPLVALISTVRLFYLAYTKRTV